MVFLCMRMLRETAEYISPSLTKILDSGKEVCAVFFDIQKAFDTIPHHALMQKLQYAGLNNHMVFYIGSVAT